MAGFLSKLFGGKKEEELPEGEPVFTDMHSHVLPGLDDGAENPEQSVELMQSLYSMGYRKLIMTPHIMGDFYKNTPEGIREKLLLLKKVALEAKIDLELDCAAEYYLDEWFIERLSNGSEILTFGGDNKYLLFETSYINKPINFREAIFAIQTAGYKAVLAHPERYTYLYNAWHELEEVRNLGVLFQLNINSLSGYYSGAAKKFAEQMIDARLVDFVGTDAHHTKHLRALERSRTASYYKKLLSLPLLNNTL